MSQRWLASGRSDASDNHTAVEPGTRTLVESGAVQGSTLMKSGAAWIATVTLAVAGCATSASRAIQVDYDRSADLDSYRTYGFPEEVGTDRAGYSTILSRYFKDAVNREMQRRGFVYEETDPDLLVNFFSNVREVTDVRRSPQASFGYGYYGYRYGLYGAWPYYDDYVDTVRYKVGTANIDIVDGERMQLIWEGVAEGRITEAAMDNPRVAVDAVVAELFQQFSGVAAEPGSVRSTSGQNPAP
jgi:hypothetical protein